MNSSRKRSRSRIRRIALAIVGTTLSAAGLAYVFHGVGCADLSSSIDSIRLAPLAGSILVYWGGLVVLRAFLVRHLLSSMGAIGVGQAYRYICIGFLANNVLPFRAGDMARSAVVCRGTGMRFASVVGGLAIERMLDMAWVAVIGVAAIQVAPPLPQAVRSVALATGVGLAVAFAIAIAVARGRWREVPPDPDKRVRSFFWNLWVRFSAGLAAMGSTRGILLAVAFSAGIWALALATIVLRLSAFDLEPSLPVAMVLLTCLGFGVAVPSAPGFIGVYHAAAAFALEVFGVPHGTAAAFGLFSWLVDIGASSLAGAVSLPIEGIAFGDLRRRAGVDEGEA